MGGGAGCWLELGAVTSDQGIRLRVNATVAALVFALLSGAAGIVWGASKLSTAVASVQATASELSSTLYTVSLSVQDLRERVGVLEDRADRPPVYPRPRPYPFSTQPPRAR